MTSLKKATTDDYSPDRFRPHGRIEFSVLEDVLICEAIGPFNLELISAVAAVERSLTDALTKQGRWGDIVVFKDSAMASREVLSAFTEYLRSLSASNPMWVATALVIQPEVEGHGIMDKHYLKCYQDTGLKVAMFAKFEEAHIWIKGEIEQKRT